MTGPQRKKLCRALEAAFPDPGELAQLVNFGLNRNLEAIVAPGNLGLRIFNLVVKCEAQGWLDDLLVAAREENPGNPDLELVVWEVGQDIGIEPKQPGEGELQRVVVDNSKFQNPDNWLVEMASKLKSVCRVESSQGIAAGTGFLVGPSLVMTNRHVVNGFKNPAEAVFRFDYRILPGGKPLRMGKEFKLAVKDWLVSDSPVGKLDYALMKLQGTPGEESPGQSRKSVARGWLKPTVCEFQKGEPMVIVQHPKGRQMEMAFGSVLDGSGKEWVNHSVSTEEGSSGSPCFNSSLELVALHYWGSDKKNAAIRFSAILDNLGEAARKLLPK
jgi:hypothetical protein